MRADAAETASVPEAAGPLPVASGLDLSGYSALPLLGAGEGPGAPWLFVFGATTAWLSEGIIAEARFVEAEGNYAAPWPLAPGALAGVVIDGDSLVREKAGPLERVVQEAWRTTANAENVFVVCSHRAIPRRLHAWREYGRETASAWRKAIVQADGRAEPIAHLSLDGRRLTQVIGSGPEFEQHSRAVRDADRIVYRAAGPTPPRRDVISAIVGMVAQQLDCRVTIDKMAVRKIGKTAILLSASDGRRYILRVARSPIAQLRGARNFEALAQLRLSSLPRTATALVPEPVARGTHRGYPFFVETCLDGGACPTVRAGSSAAASQALDYITALHAATRNLTRLTPDQMNRLVHGPLARLLDACPDSSAQEVLQRIGALCDRALAGRVLPLVRTHGDFTLSNCLFATDGRLTGVVDWELSLEDGLPLLDLLQLMPITDESDSHPRWQRFERWMQFVQQPERASQDSTLGGYLRALSIPVDVIPALMLVQWVTHVADRVGARKQDERWSRLRLWQPLHTLKGILRD